MVTAVACLLSACASPDSQSGRPKESQIKFVSWALAEQTGGTDSVLATTLDFSIVDFKRDEFWIFEQFETQEPGRTKGVSKAKISPGIGEGRTVVSVRMQDAMNDPILSKPLRVKFLIVKRLHRGSEAYTVVATTPFYGLSVDDQKP
jgi:hypothetical protein